MNGLSAVDRVVVRSATRCFHHESAASRIVGTGFLLGSTGLLAWGAEQSSGWLRWLLLAWFVWRVYVLLLLPVAIDAMAERDFRLNKLPKEWRDYIADRTRRYTR